MVGNIILQASLYYTFDYNMMFACLDRYWIKWKFQKMIRKWKKQRSVDNEDSLLLIEWDEAGLVARSVANQAHTKILLVNSMFI